MLRKRFRLRLTLICLICPGLTVFQESTYNSNEDRTETDGGDHTQDDEDDINLFHISFFIRGLRRFWLLAVGGRGSGVRLHLDKRIHYFEFVFNQLAIIQVFGK